MIINDHSDVFVWNDGKQVKTTISIRRNAESRTMVRWRARCAVLLTLVAVRHAFIGGDLEQFGFSSGIDVEIIIFRCNHYVMYNVYVYTFSIKLFIPVILENCSFFYLFLEIHWSMVLFRNVSWPVGVPAAMFTSGIIIQTLRPWMCLGKCLLLISIIISTCLCKKTKTNILLRMYFYLTGQNDLKAVGVGSVGSGPAQLRRHSIS